MSTASTRFHRVDPARCKWTATRTALVADPSSRRRFARGHDRREHPLRRKFGGRPHAGRGSIPGGQRVVLDVLEDVQRDDGMMQRAYKGHPVYHFVSDKAKGDAMGEMMGEDGVTAHQMGQSGAFQTIKE